MIAKELKIKNDFINKSNKKHNFKYSYSKVEYVNSITKVEIICPIHDSFWVRPDAHVRKVGCPKCKGGIRHTKEEFIKKASLLHNNLYDYSKVDYLNSSTKVEIICLIHGSFYIRPGNHMVGQSCPSCSGVKKKTTEEFIKEANIVHTNKYKYDKVSYINNKTKVIIYCPDHGYYEQIPKDHIKGRGCPKCVIYLGEEKVEAILKKYNIIYKKQHKFDDLITDKKRKLPFDFYLSDYSMCIEYDGRQHYEPVEKFGGLESFKRQIIIDSIKNEYCINNKIYLLRIQKRHDKEGFELLERILIDKKIRNSQTK